MTREESMKLLALIKVAYPYSYKDMDDATVKATVNMWFQSFSDVPYVLMEMAFNSFRVKSKYPPTVADFYEELSDLHWTACGILLDPFAVKDARVRCQYIADYTERFKNKDKEFFINYSAISKDMLAGYEQNLLGEG